MTQDMLTDLKWDVLAERQYNDHDQLSFADMSGDYNPIHVNPIEARR